MKTKNVRRVLCTILTFALCLQLGMGSQTAKVEAAKKATLQTKKLSMKVGQKKSIKIKNKVKKAKYTFKSNKTKVASVSKSGKVTAKKKGSAVITVKQTLKKKVKTVGKVKVTVKAKSTATQSTPSATDTPAANTPNNGNNTQVTPTPTPNGGGNTNVTPTPSVTPTPAPTEEPPLIDEDFESGSKGSFTQMGNVTLTVVDGGHESNKCLEISGRTATWNGADYNLSDVIVLGQEYSISAWLKHSVGQDTRMSITYCYTPEDPDNIPSDVSLYNGVCYGQAEMKDVPSGEWTQFSGTFTIPEGATGYKFYFEINDETASFMVDDVLLTGAKKEVAGEPDLDEFVATYYDGAVENSFVSEGNSYRMNKVIEKAKAGEEVNIAFIGGSITEGADLSSNADCYANQTYLLFKEKYGKGDGSNVHYVNAGMSGTPSALGSIRYERDVVQALGGKEPDLVFVEFAVNDGGNTNLNFRTYESFVRSLLKKDNAPAVMLIFSVFDTGFNLQNNYIPVGEAYNLPMVSIKNGITSEIAAGRISNNQFFNMKSSTPGLHPNAFGAKFMADCIMNTIDKTNQKSDKTDATMPTTLVFDTLETLDNIKGDSFEGIQMIDPNTIPGEVTLNAGDFNTTDTNVGTFLFNNQPKFPTNWQHAKTAGANSFKMTVTCKNMLLAYKLSNSSDAGKIDIYVDGTKVTTLDGYSSSGWNNAETALIFNDENAAEHEIEIKMADGNAAKEFTILTLGYTK